MNKQALAFISMFTLVLMLSIYYVSLETMPSTNDQIVSDVTSVMSLMNEQNTEKRDTLLIQLKEQLGSSQTSEEKKKEVLNQIESIEDYKKIETKIIESLSSHQIKSVVSIEEDIVHVTIFEIEKSEKKAEEIMLLIHPLIHDKQTIELIFS